MEVENNQPMSQMPEGQKSSSERMAELRAKVEVSHKRTQEIAKATKIMSGKEESPTPEIHHSISKAESDILKNRAKTIVYRSFGAEIESITERMATKNKMIDEINKCVIVSDDTIPTLENNEITVSKFKEKYGILDSEQPE